MKINNIQNIRYRAYQNYAHKINTARQNRENHTSYSLDYCSTIKSYNIPFLGKRNESEDEIYIIDAYADYKKFKNSSIAGKIIGSTASKVEKCASGKIDAINGFICAFADDVEEAETNGIKKEDKELIRLTAGDLIEMYPNQKLPHIITGNAVIEADETGKINVNKGKDDASNLPMGIPLEDATERNHAGPICEPFYVMDKKERWAKYYTQSHVAKHLEVSSSSIRKCLTGQDKRVKGCAILPESKIESKDENGNLIINLDALRENLELKPKRRFYSISLFKISAPFDDVKKAAKHHSISPHTIKTSLSGHRKTSVRGIMFVDAEQIETKDKNGKIKPDKQKIKEIRQLIAKEGIYIVANDDSIERYDNPKDAQKAIGIDPKSFSKCIHGYQKTFQGNVIIKAEEVETFDENGTLQVDYEKINSTAKAKRNRKDVRKLSETGYYAIHKNGKVSEKLFSCTEGEKVLEVNHSCILACLDGKSQYSGNYVFVFPDEIEIKNEDGTITYNEKVIQEKLKIFEKYAVYVIDKERKIERYDSQREAGKATGVDETAISECISGTRTSSHNLAFISAIDLEIEGEDGTISLREDLIDEKIKWLKHNELYVLNEDGTYKKYTNRGEVEEKFSISKSTLHKCLTGAQKTSKGHVYVEAKELEIIKDDGTIEINQKVLEEKMKLFLKPEKEEAA